jgi:hypothetical protein
MDKLCDANYTAGITSNLPASLTAGLSFPSAA